MSDFNVLQKWNYKEKKYKNHEVVKDWNVQVYEEDMDQLINCANCGKREKYGNCYTSKTIHTSAGFGFAICDDCYNEELKEAMEEQKQ